MKQGWEQKKLGEVCKLIKRGIAPKYVDKGGIRVINQKCIRNHRINYDVCRRNDVVRKTVPLERLIQNGDVLVNSTGTGTLGRIAQVNSETDVPTTVDTHVTILRPKDGLFYAPFFGYAMIAVEGLLQKSGTGTSGQTELSRADLEEKFEIKYPISLEEQKCIVAVLDEAFKGLETACVNAEANLKNAEELFQSSLQRVIGEEAFKQGWELKELGDVVELSPKKRITKETLTGESPVSFAPMENLQSGSRSFMSAEDRPLASVYSSYTYFANGDVLLAKITPCFENGKLGVASGLTNGVGFGSSEFMVLRPSSSILPVYLYYYLDQEQFRVWAAKQMTGAVGHKRVPKELIANLKLPLPPLEEQERIASKLDDMRANLSSVKEQYKSQLEDIIVLRQSLLQKAFAGELT